jgi:hypothetical protein
LFAESGPYKIRTNERRFSVHCLRIDRHACYRNRKEERTAPGIVEKRLMALIDEPTSPEFDEADRAAE